MVFFEIKIILAKESFHNLSWEGWNSYGFERILAHAEMHGESAEAECCMKTGRCRQREGKRLSEQIDSKGGAFTGGGGKLKIAALTADDLTSQI